MRYSQYLTCFFHHLLYLTSFYTLVSSEGNAIGGIFRYGHIHWTSTGNKVTFTVETAYQRTVKNAYFAGSAPDGFAQEGDVVTLFGREAPVFDFGDSSIVRMLKMKVIAYSVEEDWIMGETVLTHRYSFPTNSGRPWIAQLLGCCRLASLANNQNAEYLLYAEVDLNVANMSPRSQILPQVTLPATSPGDPPATFFVPGGDPANRRPVEWYVDTPFQVGDAVDLAGGTWMSMSLAPFAAAAAAAVAAVGGSNTQQACVAQPAGPGCFFELLRMTPFDVASQGNRPLGSPGLTVEGWFKLADSGGGVLLSVSSANGLAGAGSAAGNCSTSTAPADLLQCRLGLLYIAANSTHVTVGHEGPSAANVDAPERRTVSFAAASSPDLLASLSDPSLYPDQPLPTMEGKWVHVAVVRKIRFLRDSTAIFYTSSNIYLGGSYKVFVNGFQLGVPSYPGVGSAKARDSCPASASLRTRRTRCGGLWPQAGASSSGTLGDLLGEGFEFGESEALPAFGPDALAWGTLGSATSLVFGGYGGGAALGAARGSGGARLDEWRLWNGARSESEILRTMRLPLTPALARFYGDPTVAAGDGSVSWSNYRTAAALLAGYSFDAALSSLAKAPAGGAAPDGGGASWGACAARDFDACFYREHTPIFPGCEQGDTWCADAYKIPDARFAGVAKRIYRLKAPPAAPCATTTAAAAAAAAAAGLMCPRKSPADASGAVFYGLAGAAAVEAGSGRVSLDASVPGLYQLSVRMAMPGGAASVPVDLTVRVLAEALPTLALLGAVLSGVYVGPETAGAAAAAALLAGGGDVFDTSAAAAAAALAPLAGGDPRVPADVTVFVGTEVRLVARAAPPAGGGGGPLGFSVGALPARAALSAPRGGNGSDATLRWVPCAGDAGYVTVCLEAVAAARVFQPAGSLQGALPAGRRAPPRASEMRCVGLRVMADQPPTFLPPTPAAANFTMGRAGGFVVAAADENCVRRLALEAAEAPAGSPAAEDARAGASHAGSARMLGLLPAGAALGAAEATAPSGGRLCAGLARRLDWTPSYAFGGFRQWVCFRAGGEPPSGSVCGSVPVHWAYHCVLLTVHRCRYALLRDERMEEVAPRFGLDWMQLWSFNPAVRHPDYFVYSGQEVNVGRLYRAGPSESLEAAAARLGMPLAQMLDLNSDLHLDPALRPGRVICVAPDSCSGQAQTAYSSMRYRDDKFLYSALAAPLLDAPAP